MNRTTSGAKATLQETPVDSRTLKPGRYAAIDVGTVTCRLLIADVDAAGSLREVFRDRAICNLGVGVDETGRLARESIERVGGAVDRFAQAIHDYRLPDQRPLPVMAVATSATRDAENAADFSARVQQAGIHLQVIPGQREAALSFAGATGAYVGQRVVVVDAGGGSTEVIAGLGAGEPVHARSFNVGCRRVTERFFHDDPPTPESVAQAAAWMRDEFASYVGTVRDEGWFDGRLVAVAGTATSVISMREQMREYDRAFVDGAIATRADVDALLERLSALTVQERRQVVGLEPGRAPVIVGGLLILQQLMDLAGADAFTASESDILQGIILASAAL